VIASVALLLGTLMLLDRGHPVVNVAVATLLPLGLYLLFERLLDADLPSGLLWS
jgi:putative tricarboxylic transport membrane protein